jgi:hypothetical protein
MAMTTGTVALPPSFKDPVKDPPPPEASRNATVAGPTTNGAASRSEGVCNEGSEADSLASDLITRLRQAAQGSLAFWDVAPILRLIASGAASEEDVISVYRDMVPGLDHPLRTPLPEFIGRDIRARERRSMRWARTVAAGAMCSSSAARRHGRPGSRPRNLGSIRTPPGGGLAPAGRHQGGLALRERIPTGIARAAGATG